MAAADRGTRPEAAEQGAWGRPVPRRTGEILMAVALFATAAFFVSQAAYLQLGTVGLPGSGFFPLALGIALGLASAAILYVSVRTPDRTEVVYLGHRNVVAVLAALAGLAFAFERADTYLVLGGFVVALLLVVARTAPWRALLGASLGMVLVWFVFNVALGVRLPTGELWERLLAPIGAGLFTRPF